VLGDAESFAVARAYRHSIPGTNRYAYPDANSNSNTEPVAVTYLNGAGPA
jgi:hypothetical protein